MVDIDKVKEEDMTTEEVLDKHTVQPKTEVEILPVWEECPDEAPGDNTRVEDNTLLWERDGFEVALKSHETTHWLAEISVPHEYGQFYPRPVDAKCSLGTQYSHVDDVEIEDYVLSTVTLLLAENFMPTFEVNQFIDQLIEDAEAGQEFRDDLNAAMDAAVDSTE